MTISPGTNFDDPRFRDDERTPVQRMRDGDYYIADDELSALTRRAVRLLSLYEQAHPTDPDIARYLLSLGPRRGGGERRYQTTPARRLRRQHIHWRRVMGQLRPDRP